MSRAGRRFILVLALGAGPANAQSVDTTVAAGSGYAAGNFHQWLFGHGYRDLWASSIAVPVLDLRSFAGGLVPLKAGGGLQTKSLRLSAADGSEYAFRSVDKWIHLPRRLKGTIVEALFRDQLSASFPAGGVVTAPLLEAAGVLHATPIVVLMPDDSLLGEFRHEFAGRLGTLEQYPSKPEHGNGFGGAVDIIDSDSLLTLLNRDPTEWVDARALLTACLVDLLVNDPDRHPGQWKWARMAENPKGPWLPVARDRDQAFIDYGGLLPGVLRKLRPNLVAFRADPHVPGLTYNSLETDRRLLGALGKPAWDSVVAALIRRLPDRVIDSAVGAMPAAYRSRLPQFGATLKDRRDHLPAAADVFYRMVTTVADIHGTAAAERATVTRLPDGSVEVRLEPRDGQSSVSRRYDPRITTEIRLYLHEGDDSAVVTGHAQQSIPVWIIGGNGNNWLADSSQVGRRRDRARFYDAGRVEGVRYGPDTLFNRRPWIKDRGSLVAPFRDRGGRMAFAVALGSDRGLGPVPGLAVFRYRYGFGRRPYASRIGIEAEYATHVDRIRAGVTADQRWERTPIHFMAQAHVSGFELINYHGLGNAAAGSPATAFQLRQQQWLVHPALALALSTVSDLSIGPVLRYSTTDSAASPSLSSRPYGSGRFGEAGIRLGLHHDGSDRPLDPSRRVKIELTATYYPAAWDVTSPFGRVSAAVGTLVRLPIPTHPVVVLRAGGVKVFGDFPFHEAAFIAGGHTVRFLDAQRYAGDASLYGTAELRIPVLAFSLVLPFDIGLVGLADAGRVYLKGRSPGGWHQSVGGGVWLGIPETGMIVTVAATTEQGRFGLRLHSGLKF